MRNAFWEKQGRNEKNTKWVQESRLSKIFTDNYCSTICSLLILIISQIIVEIVNIINQFTDDALICMSLKKSISKIKIMFRTFPLILVSVICTPVIWNDYVFVQ